MSLPAPPPAWPAPRTNPPPLGMAPMPYGPPQQLGGPGPLRPVGLSEMVRSATPGAVISLVVGGIVGPLALPLLLVAQVLASRARHRRRQVATLFRVAVWGSMVLGLLGAWWSLRSVDVFLLWNHANAWARVACWISVVGLVLIQGDALRRNERPEDL